MPLYKFRICLEDDDSIFRDIEILPTQSFQEFHLAIQTAFQFDAKHQASFYKSNDSWHKGKEVSLIKKEGALLAEKVPMVYFIDDPHQKILYVYDPDMQWTFYCELMTITEEKPKINYPLLVRTEGLAPKQYGNSPIVSSKDDVFEEVVAFDEHEMEDRDDLGDDTVKDDSDSTNEDGADEGEETGDGLEVDSHEDY
jgi:hypothetical protein